MLSLNFIQDQLLIRCAWHNFRALYYGFLLS